MSYLHPPGRSRSDVSVTDVTNHYHVNHNQNNMTHAHYHVPLLTALTVLGILAHGLLFWLVPAPASAQIPNTLPVEPGAPPNAAPSFDLLAAAAAVTPSVPLTQTLPAPATGELPSAEGLVAPLALQASLEHTTPVAHDVGVAVQTADALNVRAYPNLSGRVKETVSAGTIGEVLTHSLRADGYHWQIVSFADGSRGWVAIEYLRSVTPAMDTDDRLPSTDEMGTPQTPPVTPSLTPDEVRDDISRTTLPELPPVPAVDLGPVGYGSEVDARILALTVLVPSVSGQSIYAQPELSGHQWRPTDLV